MWNRKLLQSLADKPVTCGAELRNDRNTTCPGAYWKMLIEVALNRKLKLLMRAAWYSDSKG